MIHEGALTKNTIGRFEFDGFELRSGDRVEVFVGVWVRGHVEFSHDRKTYVLYVRSGEETEAVLSLHTGMKARTPT